jgi:internalin A
VAFPTLQQIDFSGTPVTDVAVLANCPKLTSVSGSDSGVTDIAPLARLTQLDFLKFSGCDLSGLSPELRFESLRLRTLNLQNTGITTLEPFSDLTQITTAYLGYNDLSNAQLQILAKSTETLKYLDLSGTGFQCAGVTADTWIDKCQNLRELYLDNTRLTDLSFTKDMTALTTLSAYSCGLQDISDLGKCTALTRLCLANNDMENLDGLAEIPLERSDYARFDFTGCENLTDISGLPEVEYSRLCLAGCPNINYGTAGNISGQNITLNYNATFTGSHLETNPFTAYYILDCPADQKVALEDLLGSYRVKYVTYGPELAQIMVDALQMSCDYLTETEEN